MRVSVFLAAVLLISNALGCGKGDSEEEGDRLNVVCTTPQVGDVVKNVGGKHVKVTVLMEGESIDPHTYPPKQKDIIKLKEADIIFYSGHHLEGKIGEVLEDMGKDKPTVALAEVIPETDLIKDEDNAIDPHVWFDPDLWKLTAKPVAEQLAKLDKANKADFEKNAKAYATQLTDLKKELAETLKDIPQDHRVLITSHDAFSYFGKAFNIRVNARQGISTAMEPSGNVVSKLVELIKKENVPAIFIEKSVGKEAMEAIEEGAGVTIYGSLYSDSMGKPGTDEGTYVGMMRYNAKTIAAGLGTK